MQDTLSRTIVVETRSNRILKMDWPQPSAETVSSHGVWPSMQTEPSDSIPVASTWTADGPEEQQVRRPAQHQPAQRRRVQQYPDGQRREKVPNRGNRGHPTFFRQEGIEAGEDHRQPETQK